MAIWELTQNFIPNDILHAKEIRSPLLTVVDINNNNEYSLPSVKPSVPAILEVLPDGTSQFLDAAGLIGNPDALINVEPSVVPTAGTVPIFDGTNAFNVKSQSILAILNDDVYVNGTLRLLAPSYQSSSFNMNVGENLQITNESSLGGSINITSTTGDINLNSQVGAVGISGSNIYLTTGGNIQLSASTSEIQFITGAGIGCSFNSIGSINSSGSDLVVGNGSGNLQLSSKFNDVIVSTEGGKFQVQQGSEFQGDMTINKVDPQLNFNNTDHPTQLCNIAFESASQELIMEHHSPDLASKCNIRLGTNDINIQSTFSGLNAGNINLTTGITGLTYINNYSLPNVNPTTDGQVLSANIDGTSSWVSSIPTGLLRAINCNLITPTEIVDVVWSNLTPTEQLAWKGGDPTTSDPIQSATDNYWNFTKAGVSLAKIGWFIPDDFSALSFQDLQSFWVVIRFNTNTNISVEGSLYLSLQTSPPTGLNTFRTRWNYSNPATPMNQTGYFYKLYALDTITTTTVANFGKGQEIDQTQFKNNPCNVSPDLWSIALNKQVLSPTGDTTAGYTTAPLQNISLQTASNINTFNFDVVSIGYLNKQYNLHFA
jgi:hypothetical protein